MTRWLAPDGWGPYWRACVADLVGGLLAVAWMLALFQVLDWVLP